MKTFIIIAIIDKIIDFLDITLVLPIYLPTIYGDWILSPSSIKKATQMAQIITQSPSPRTPKIRFIFGM
jgi:hypothetical protein